jgi:peptide/nickel transport system substrate-binding protein
VNIPANNAKQDELLTKLIGDGGVEQQYADLDKAYMDQAVWAPYGNEQFTTFLSERMDFDKSYHHLLFNQDYSSFAIK